jgi:tetratricopeptide (TPR) repeat protein
MKKLLYFLLLLCFAANTASAQTAKAFDLSEFGIKIQPDARLISVMMALEAAGFESKQDSLFRSQIREDLKTVDPDLQRRLREFYQRNKIYDITNSARGTEAPASEQAARYVSLAYALGQPPDFLTPARSTELPAGLLEVLDFAPLVQEFYRKQRLSDKMPELQSKYQGYGDKLRPQASVMVRELTAYLNTRPQTVYFEKITTKSQPAKEKSKKPALERVEIRERARNFYIVPDLLAVPGTVKARVIGDNYYATVAPEVNPTESSELRRAYLQYLIDALVFKNAKEITVQRDAIRSILDDLSKSGGTISPDVYLAVARSLVVAADAKQIESKKISALTNEARARIEQVKTTPEKLTVSENLKQAKAQSEKETFLTLSEAYADGAVLAFFFADQLRGLEGSGFDIASSLTDMIATFDATKEKARLKENETARNQAVAELAARRRRGGETVSVVNTASEAQNVELVKNLREVEEMVTLRDYDKAENRLKELLNIYKGEPQIFFALGRTAGKSASEAIDESVRDERLKKAEAFYRGVVVAGNDGNHKSLLSQSHFALGRIYEFYERNDEALKAYDAAIAIGPIQGGAYLDAQAAKARLTQK